ncbi:MAG: long-chain fatty acid--CoA ligase [Leptospirales bacterium]|nr:long-chain fatty acid--CoA ligase [Leptospirales bacterium]
MKNLAEIIAHSAREFASLPAFATRKTGTREFETITYSELHAGAMALAAALIDLGLSAREHVGLFCDNRREWILADLAIILSGAADVPRATDVTDHDISHIVPHSDMKILFVENRGLLDRILRNPAASAALSGIILIEGQLPDIDRKPGEPRLFTFSGLLEKGRRLGEGGVRQVLDRISAIKPDDLFTLIYTSGTTGTPRGVMLTHANIVSQISRIPISIDPSDRILSILPVWHIFERVFEMIALARGCCTFYSSVRTLRDDLAIVKPTFMASAPRLWESIYQGVRTNVDKAPNVRRKLFSVATGVAGLVLSAKRRIRGTQLEDQSGIMVRLPGIIWSAIFLILIYPLFLLLDRIVLAKIRSATGGNLRGSCSGGGALPYHVDLFFNAIGIPVLEGYGMTETSPVISVRTFERLVPGTVGPIFKDTEVRILDLQTGNLLFSTEAGAPKVRYAKGEIHVRGPQVMKGYYKDPEATARVLRDGWMNTGDLGIMTWNDCLKIVGRSKETIVLLSGENVEPVPIENRIQQSPFVTACMVVGQDQKFLGVLVVPALDRFEGLESYEAASRDERALATIRSEVKRLVDAEAGFKVFERIGDVRLLPRPFEVGDELTAKLSIRRHIVTEKYAKLIAEMYSDAR